MNRPHLETGDDEMNTLNPSSGFLSASYESQSHFSIPTYPDPEPVGDGVEVQYLSLSDAITIGQFVWAGFTAGLEITGQWGADLAAGGHPDNASLEGS
jgi:hypothetical protein